MNDIQAVMSGFAGVVTYARWVSHNCPACIHNGQPRPDTRNRGGVRIESDGSYAFNCFNCGYKATWKPGIKFTDKMQKLAKWYGATDTQIISMTLLAEEMYKSGEYEVDFEKSSKIYSNVIAKEMPDQAKPFREWAQMPNPPAEFIEVISKMVERNRFMLTAIDYWWTPQRENFLSTRFLIPFVMNNQIVGYTGRSVRDLKLKYFNQYPSHAMYNFDLLNDPNVQDIIVTEGPIDAAMVGGVAVCHNMFKDNHIDWLQKCQKNIIVVPDRDHNGQAMVQQAIQAGFSVAFPDWGTTVDDNGERRLIKDIEEATRKYGRLYARYMISKATYKDNVDIRVQAARWF